MASPRPPYANAGSWTPCGPILRLDPHTRARQAPPCPGFAGQTEVQAAQPYCPVTGAEGGWPGAGEQGCPRFRLAPLPLRQSLSTATRGAPGTRDALPLRVFGPGREQGPGGRAPWDPQGGAASPAPLGPQGHVARRSPGGGSRDAGALLPRQPLRRPAGAGQPARRGGGDPAGPAEGGWGRARRPGRATGPRGHRVKPEPSRSRDGRSSAVSARRWGSGGGSWVPARLRDRNGPGRDALSPGRARKRVGGGQVTLTPRTPGRAAAPKGRGSRGRGPSPVCGVWGFPGGGTEVQMDPSGGPRGTAGPGPGPAGATETEKERETFLRTHRCSRPRCLKEVKMGKPQTHPLDVFQTGLPRRVANVGGSRLVYHTAFSDFPHIEINKNPSRSHQESILWSPRHLTERLGSILPPFPPAPVECEDQTLPPLGQGTPGVREDSGAGRDRMGLNQVWAAPIAGSGFSMFRTRTPSRQPFLPPHPQPPHTHTRPSEDGQRAAGTARPFPGGHHLHSWNLSPAPAHR